MQKILILCLFFLSIGTSFTQNVKTEKLEYNYIKLPISPLSKNIKNYQSSVFAAYEAENMKKKAQYDSEMQAAEVQYQKEMAEYPSKIKASDEKYALDMAEWEKKSLAEKVVEKKLLNENNRPVKQVPSQPYKKYIEKPVLQTSYDYPALAATYIFLGGFENKPENAVKVDVTLYGYDYTKPRQLTAQKSSVSVANGVSTTKQVTYYHIEFTYRHTMSVKVTSPDGKEIMFLTPPELNTYSVYKSAESTTSQTINEEQLVKTYEEKVLRENLTFINHLVNDKIGFMKELRASNLSFVKSKDDLYGDLMTAYNEASIAFKSLIDDSITAREKLKHAAEIWNEALKESNLENKKARIDKEVTTMIYFNLLETYFALQDPENSDNIISALNKMSLSNSDRKLKETYELLTIDLKKRILANK